MAKHLPERLAREIGDLKSALPPHSEIARIIGNMDDPASDEASKDRYVAIVAANVVEGALRLCLTDKLDPQPHKRPTFEARITKAEKLGIVTPAQAVELHRIREVRNVFAHALLPVDFNTPAVTAVTSLLWEHPVDNWAAYFAPIFPPRHRFAIICGAFVRNLQPNA